MHFVKTELRRSPLDGQGLFTTHALPMGTIVGTQRLKRASSLQTRATNRIIASAHRERVAIN